MFNLFVHAIQVFFAEHVERHGFRHAGLSFPAGRSRLLIIRTRSCSLIRLLRLLSWPEQTQKQSMAQHAHSRSAAAVFIKQNWLSLLWQNTKAGQRLPRSEQHLKKTKKTIESKSNTQSPSLSTADSKLPITSPLPSEEPQHDNYDNSAQGDRWSAQTASEPINLTTCAPAVCFNKVLNKHF